MIDKKKLEKNINKIILKEIALLKFNNDNYKELKEVLNYTNNILKIDLYPIDNIDYKEYVDSNDCINTTYDFLKTIDMSLADRMLNSLSGEDKDGNLLVRFYDYNETNGKVKNQNINNTVNISLENNPNDYFDFIHEMMHHLEYYENYEGIIRLLPNRGKKQKYLSEIPSILIELLFGRYLVDNNKITLNDFKIKINDRIENTKFACKDLIIENELFNQFFIDSGVRIEELYMKTKVPNSSFFKAGINKKDIDKVIRIINSNNKMMYKQDLPYVIAFNYINNLYNNYQELDDIKDMFLNMEKILENNIDNYDYVMDNIIKPEEDGIIKL